MVLLHNSIRHIYGHLARLFEPLAGEVRPQTLVSAEDRELFFREILPYWDGRTVRHELAEQRAERARCADERARLHRMARAKLQLHSQESGEPRRRR